MTPRWDDSEVRLATLVAIAIVLAVLFTFLRHSAGATIWRTIDHATCRP